MKSYIYQTSLTAVVALLMAVAVVFADSNTVVVGNIPFDFHVGQATLPAGKYIVRLDSVVRGYISIRSEDGSKNAMVQVTPSTPNNKKTGMLVFRQYGSDYFLSLVSEPGQPGQQILQTKLEREIAKRDGPAHSAEVALGKR